MKEEQPIQTEKVEEQKVRKKKDERKAEKKEVQLKTHVVAAGDTLRSISKKYYGSASKINAIRNLNHLATDSLRIGRELLLP